VLTVSLSASQNWVFAVRDETSANLCTLLYPKSPPIPKSTAQFWDKKLSKKYTYFSDKILVPETKQV